MLVWRRPDVRAAGGLGWRGGGELMEPLPLVARGRLCRLPACMVECMQGLARELVPFTVVRTGALLPCCVCWWPSGARVAGECPELPRARPWSTDPGWRRIAPRTPCTCVGPADSAAGMAPKVGERRPRRPLRPPPADPPRPALLSSAAWSPTVAPAADDPSGIPEMLGG